jgi:hypothetical protein
MEVFEVKRIGPFALYGPDGNMVSSGLLSKMRRLGKEAAETVRDSGGVDVQVQEFDDDGRLVRVIPCYVKTDTSAAADDRGQDLRESQADSA